MRKNIPLAVGDKVQLKSIDHTFYTGIGTVVGLELTDTGERAARVAYETELGVVAKLFFTRKLRRA